MPLSLQVDGERWRAHLREVQERFPGLVPVAKGNGYGLGLHRLARKAAWLGVDTLAIGTYEEIAHVEQRYDGSLLVLTPWRPWNRTTVGTDRARLGRVVHTVGRLEDLADLASLGEEVGVRPRVVLERLTSMLRHGFDARGLRGGRRRGTRRAPASRVSRCTCRSPRPRHVDEVARLLTDVVSAGLENLGTPATVWVSHLTETELATLAMRYPDLVLRPRVGTELWLGDRGALGCARRCSTPTRSSVATPSATADARPPGPGRSWSSPAAPPTASVWRPPRGTPPCASRAASIARGGLDAAGFVRSPFTVGGKQRLFAEPPHMQASMLFLPAGSPCPAVGDEVDVRVRFTATDVDEVLLTLIRPPAPGRARPCRAPPSPRGRARRRPAPRRRGRRRGTRRRRLPSQPPR